jgi:hypothetical protein
VSSEDCVCGYQEVEQRNVKSGQGTNKVTLKILVPKI